MNFIWILAALVAIAIIAAAVGLVKNVLRLVIALALGVLAGGLVYYAIDALSLFDTVPNAIPLLAGALAALGVLLKRK